jgi:predicted AlkP superfamily phosphohydrolase/phosphomutase
MISAMKRLFVLFALVAAVPSFAIDETGSRRMIVLGIDGMDPVVLQSYIDAGLAPNLEKLAMSGGFMPLGTTVPPQSPVAWSSFITGMNPGGHGLFDFLAIDRQTLEPYMSSVRVVRSSDLGTMSLGDWQLPLVVEETNLLRQGKAFWEMLGEQGIPTRIFRVPANYPPTGIAGGKIISGMGTPDLKGSSGTFAFYTDDPRRMSGPVSGGEIIRVARRNNVIHTELYGPVNPFLKNGDATGTELVIELDPDSRQATLTIGDQSLTLSEGEWSDWAGVNFDIIPAVISPRGMVRFYLQEAGEFFRLYVSPVNIDPREPAQPIATPVEYAFELAEHAGPFYTQEMPEDTKALSAGILQPEEFFEQSELVLDERRKLLQYELEQFQATPGSAFMFFYFSSLDLRNHMLARQQDPEHPYHEENTSAAMANAMRTTYEEFDEIVGWLLESTADDTALVVMSDHGFSQFRTQVNLNTWLEREGYLYLSEPDSRSENEWLEGVDWTRTKAFAIGLNSLYINVKGRDKNGIVEPEDREALAQEITAKLARWVDEDTGNLVVTQPLTREEAYSGPQLENAPDILVGYGAGYRASWATTSGEIPAVLLEPNINEWSGDHCVDARLVPGVLLTNRPLQMQSADLRDLTAAIVAYFGIELPEQLEGQPVF